MPPTVITALRPAPDQPAVDLTQPGAATSPAVLRLVEAHFSGDSPTGVFRCREGPGTQAARQRLLAALKRSLHSWDAGACEGWAGDSSAVEGELRVALCQAARTSGAGADGLPYGFWEAFWHLAAPYLVAAFNEALASDSDEALASLLLGVIILIHKPGKAADLLAGYRPITLLNTDIRLWAKVLANRLQVPLDELIDPEQTAFIGGREIGDRINHLRALIAYLQQRHEPLWLLLSDLASAYDSVNWGWLEACMLAMGFRAGGHVRWALLMHRGARSAVVINGWRLQPFPLRGGLMQGSGVSPLYWTIVLQPLVAHINSLGTLQRMPLPPLGGPQGEAPAEESDEETTAAPMGAYADDGQTALTGPGLADRQPAAVLEASRTYEEASGVAPAINKTELEGAVDADGRFGALFVSARVAQEAQAEARGDRLPPEAPVHHPALGVLLAPPGSAPRVLGVGLTADEQAARERAFASAPGAIRATATGWLPMQLGQAQRVMVAKTCLASKMVYQMQFHRLPQAAGRQAQAAIRGFVAAPADPTEAAPNAGRLWPREAVAALPPRQGGMGYPMLRHANGGLLAKAAAQAFTPGTQVWKALFLGMFAGATRAGGAAGPAGVREEGHGQEGGGRPAATWPVVAAAAATASAAARQWVGRCAGALPPALQAHTQALLALGPKRVVKPSEMGFFSVMVEPVCWNPDILVGEGAEGEEEAGEGEEGDEGRGRRGRCLQPGDLGQAAGALCTLGDVRRALLLGPAAPPAVAAAAARVRAGVPAAWLPHLDAAGEPAPSWWCTAGRSRVMGDKAVFAIAGPTPPGPGWDQRQWAAALYRRLPTGRLVPACPGWALDGEEGRAADPAAQRDAAAYLAAAAAALCPPAARWLPAAVFDRAKPQHRWTQADHEAVAAAWGNNEGGAAPQLDAAAPREAQQEVPPEPWLAGPWVKQPLDPTVWGTAAGMPLLNYTVKAATACLTATAAGLQPGAALRPPIWPSAAGREGGAGRGQGPAGLAALEERWAEAFQARSADPAEAERQARGGGGGPAANPSQEEWDAESQAFLLRDAPWLQLSQGDEPRPGAAARAARAAARAATREAAARAAAEGQGEGQGEGEEPAAEAAGGGAARAGARRLADHDADAGRAWRRLNGDTTMRRSDRNVAYRIMHGALGVNALRLRVLSHLPRGEGLCPCAECRAAGHLETLSHVFLHCPSAGPVLTWMLDLWAALTPGAPQPPRDDALLLLGDRQETEGGNWRPQPGHEAMWTRLRVAWLGAAWEARCSQLSLPGVPAMPAQARARATAEALLARLTSAARLHWRRVESDVRRLSAAYPSTWFRGRDPALALDTFLEEWGMGGRFCDAAVDPAPRLVFRVTADEPAPMPPPGGDGDGAPP